MHIEIPPAWLARVRPTLAVVEIPEREIPQLVADWLLSDAVADDPWLWLESGYVYPNEIVAQRVADRFLAANFGHAGIDVRFRVGRQIVTATMAREHA